MAGGLVYWGVFGLLISLMAIPLGLLLPRIAAERLGRSILHWVLRGFVYYLEVSRLVHVDLGSLKSLRASDQPAIIAPNHTSLWDAVFVISCLPQPICVMKRSIVDNPFLGGGARLAGYISNGSSSQLIRDAATALSRGGQLVIFPEGTRTRREASWINPLKGGCALVAQRAKVPVIPVFIRSNTRYLEKDWPLWRRPQFPIHMSFELGDPLEPVPAETAQEFTTRMELVFKQNLGRAHKLRRKIT